MQKWTDTNLSIPEGLFTKEEGVTTPITMDHDDVLSDLWTPDLYIPYSRDSGNDTCLPYPFLAYSLGIYYRN